MKRYITIITIIISAACCLLTSCTQADRVRENLAQEADSFNVYRRVTVIDCITGDTLFQLTGFCSIVADTSDKQLEIITEYSQDMYSKQIIGLSDNVTYIIEDLQSTNVTPYHYEINFNPKMWLPAIPVIID